MTDFDARLQEVRKRFIARCADRADEIETALVNGSREQIGRIAHDIAGTGGVFGFNELSIEARSLDHLSKSNAPYENAARSMVLRLREIASTSLE